MRRDGTSYDVVVVGGRVAGALTAALCAARGMSVLVLEARQSLGDTISTHFFRGDGLVRVLDDVGVLDAVLATGCPPLRREAFYLGGDPAFRLDPPQEPGRYGHGLSVRRVTLDALLARHVAALPGVDFRTGVKVVDVEMSDGVAVGVRDADGMLHRGNIVVGADGRRSVVAQSVSAADRAREPGARAAYYRWVTGWRQPDGASDGIVEFSLRGNEMAYVFPSDDGVACVAISMSLQTYADARHDAGGVFERQLQNHAGLWPRYEGATPVSRFFGAPPEDSVLRVPAGPGWALVGDASTHQDPWSGLGMDTAARHAEALATTLTADPRDWNGAYTQAHDEATLERFWMTTKMATDLRQLVG